METWLKITGKETNHEPMKNKGNDYKKGENKIVTKPLVQMELSITYYQQMKFFS